MPTDQEPNATPPRDWKYRLGMGLFIYSFIPICTIELVALLPLTATEAVTLGAVYIASGERLLTVRWFGALSALLAREQARAGAPCFVYRYALPPPNGALDSLAEEAFAQGISPEKAGVPHGADLFPVFGLTSMWLGYDDADQDMARAMRTCWTNFAKTGDPGKPVQPGGPAAAPWPRFDPAAPRMIEFGRTIAVKPVLNEPLIPLVERSWRTTTY